MTDSPVIFWFRRDLRLDDNVGFERALGNGAPVLPVFIIDPRLQAGPWFGVSRQAFLFSALEALADRLRRFGGRLLALEGEPLVELTKLVNATGEPALYFNRDYTPFARKRDDAVRRRLGIPVYACDDNLLVSPEALRKDDGSAYRVYTPFRSRWHMLPKTRVCEYRLDSASLYDPAQLDLSNRLAHWAKRSAARVNIPPATEAFAQSLLRRFMRDGIANYTETRHLLAAEPFTERSESFTSYLSPYLRFGILSPRQVYSAARERLSQSFAEGERQSIESFCNQLIWREFFMHIMFHFPEARWRSFRREFDALAWREAPAELVAWKRGLTGYPIVDAAMRQLRATGWMPNRARMICASFLSKHLLIDWRAGEAHFMRHLLDGDPAANNGGWQWTAGTGADAQPFFRIFNPIIQSRKFDPDGRYIRHWLPELRDLPPNLIHTPWKFSGRASDYPPPIVEHGAARARALATFQAVRSQST